ncbi:hypothetical protein ACTRXD_09840 [Nitrospira sp. T9]
MSNKRRTLFLCGNGVLSGQEGCRQPENEGMEEHAEHYGIRSGE